MAYAMELTEEGNKESDMLAKSQQTGRFYAEAFIQLLIEPGAFFRELPRRATPLSSLGFMMICCVFYTVASLLTGALGRPTWISAGILFINASGMVLIGTVLGYIAMVMVIGRPISFGMVFGIYVFATGLPLFLSWLPFFAWLTEPWKYWLIYTGFRNTCNISRKLALLILFLSAAAQFFLIYSALLAFGK